MTLPKHIAIIMDGNGRWASARNHNRFYGHLRGAKVAKNVITQASNLNIKNLTLFTFSNENWLRPVEEVNFLMKLLVRQLKREQHRLVEQNIRFLIVGDTSRIPKDVQDVILETIALTKSCTGMQLTFALSFGGRQEIKKAMQQLAHQVAAGEIAPENIDENLISQTLESSFLPDPDLVVRTSGEHRLSNFFLWSTAYSELYFTEKYWPDFNSDDLVKAIAFYGGRERRFGRIQSPQENGQECRPYQ